MEYKEQQPSLIHYAMNFGAVMGGYYIGKFCLFPMSLRSSFAGMLFLGLTLMVPFLIYRLTTLYRDRYMGGNITFSHALAFAILTMGFGSLLASAAHYIYFAFIDGGMMVETLEQNIGQMASFLAAPTGEGAAAMTDTMAIATPSIIDTTTVATESMAEEAAEIAASIDDYITMLRTTTEQIKAMTPIDMTLGMLSNNLSWSIIVALPVAAFLTIKKRK